MLKIISTLKPNEKYKLDWIQEGLKFRACYMIVKMTNLEKLFKKEGENALIIVNKINFIIHSIAKIHLGEINQSKETIYWTEDIDSVYFQKIAYYMKLCIVYFIYF